MKMKDICKECKLTKKAIDYYEKEGLIALQKDSNGYRLFSDDDKAKLKEISYYRKLQFSIAQIREIYSTNNRDLILRVHKEKLELDNQKNIIRKKAIQIMLTQSLEAAEQYLDNNLNGLLTIKEKLLESFPDAFGLFLLYNYDPFLNDRIETKEQKTAMNNIIEYLDNIPNVEIPNALLEVMRNAINIDKDVLVKNKIDSIYNINQFLEDNKDWIEGYINFKKSEEYEQTKKINDYAIEFYKNTGYYDVFLPNLKILSPSYLDYIEQAEKANKIMLERFPHMGE